MTEKPTFEFREMLGEEKTQIQVREGNSWRRATVEEEEQVRAWKKEHPNNEMQLR